MISNLVSNHELQELLDEDLTEADIEDLVNAENVCRNFLRWELTDGGATTDVKAQLAAILDKNKVIED